MTVPPAGHGREEVSPASRGGLNLFLYFKARAHHTHTLLKCLILSIIIPDKKYSPKI